MGETKVGKIARLVIVIAIGISLLFGTLGCAKEITEPVETPVPVTTPESAQPPDPSQQPGLVQQDDRPHEQSPHQDEGYTIEQAVSDRAQENTIAFDALAFLQEILAPIRFSLLEK